MSPDIYLIRTLPNLISKFGQCLYLRDPLGYGNELHSIFQYYSTTYLSADPAAIIFPSGDHEHFTKFCSKPIQSHKFFAIPSKYNQDYRHGTVCLCQVCLHFSMQIMNFINEVLTTR
jgi:hypothetical protein